MKRIKTYKLFLESNKETIKLKIGDKITVKPPEGKTSYRGTLIEYNKDNGEIVWEDSKKEKWVNNANNITHINKIKVNEDVSEPYENIMKSMVDNDELDVNKIDNIEKDIEKIKDQIETKKEELEKKLENLENLEVETFTDENKEIIEKKKEQIKKSIEDINSEIDKYQKQIDTLKDNIEKLKK